MVTSEISLGNEQLNRLFPFYFTLGSNLSVDSCGIGLLKLMPACVGCSFTEQFSFKRPKDIIIDFSNPSSVCNQLLVLQLNNADGNLLRGQFELIPSTGQLFFAGSPWFNSMEEVNKAGLVLDDFAYHDSLVDLLHVLKTKQIDNEDLQELLTKVNSQKKELKKAAVELNEMALFPMQNPDPLFRITTRGNVIMKNPAAEKLSSFYYKGIPYAHDTFWVFLATEEKHIDDQWSFETYSGDRAYSFICRNMPGQDYFNVYGRDITQQKQNEEELKRLSLVASSNESGVLFTHADGSIFWTNEGFCQLTGLNTNEIMGKTPIELCKGSLTDKSILKKMVDAFLKGESFNVELLHYRKDGSSFWGRAKGQSYKKAGTGELQYFAMVEDISEEKEKEERLKILSQIAENNINPVIITDKQGGITWVNKSFTEMTGYNLPAILGKKPGHFLQGPETNQLTVAYMRGKIAEAAPFSAEICNYTMEEKMYWTKINGQPIHNSNGELTGFFSIQENITREKEIQTRIKESEVRFWLALEKIYENAWEHDFRTGKTSFSKSSNEFWGYDNNELNSNTLLWRNSVHANDLHLLDDRDLGYQSGEIDSHNLEYRIIHKNGTVKWVMDRGVAIEKTKNGKSLRVVGTHTDITKIKQTETELEHRVNQFKSLSENIPGVIYEYEFRADGTEGLRYISPAIERVLGINQGDFNHYVDYLSPEDKSRIMHKNELCRTTLEPVYDEVCITIAGIGMRWHSFHSSFSYVSQDGAKVFTGFMMDITERKNADILLRANEEKYRSIITNMKLGLTEFNNDTLITYANKSFCDMSGYSTEELVGKNSVSLFVTEANAAVVAQQRERRKNGGADSYILQVINKSGEPKWWLISEAPTFNDKSEQVGSIGIYLDISAQKNLEIELTEAREHAEQLARTKEMFLANMSHEIRTPMNAIIGMSNQLAKTNLSIQQKFYLDTVHSAADNLLVIINDILDLSKIEAGKLSLENIGFQPKNIAARAIQVLSHRAEEKGIRLTASSFDQRISEVLIGDPYRIHQVLLNLLTNAIKFTDKGTVDLVFTLLEDHETYQLIEVLVKDTGIGMDELFVQQLFEKFSQESDSVSRKYGGTGLGMSICQELVDLMGGSIGAKSKKGEGTTISFSLPFNKGGISDLPEKENIKIKEGFLAGKKVLIVDDNELNRLVAAVIVENYGALIIEASGGEQAVEYAIKQQPDIILMDIQMPGMNGYQATDLIRKKGLKLPIIALTANAIKGESEKCIAAGMNDYISKPFKEEDLLATIAKSLGTKVTFEKGKPANGPHDDKPLYSLEKLRNISNKNEAFVTKMVNIFCEQTPILLADMLDAMRSSNLEKIGNIAHKIKPSIDNLDIHRLKQVIRDIERTAKEGNHTALHPLVAEVEITLVNVIQQLRME